MFYIQWVRLWANLKAMQNQMMAMKRVANLSSAEKRDATFFSTWDQTQIHITENLY